MSESSKVYVNSIASTLTEHSKYLKTIHCLYQEVNGQATIGRKYLSVLKAKLTSMHHSPVQANILTEALQMILDNDLAFEQLATYDEGFLDYAKTVTERITNDNYFDYYIHQQLQRLANNTKEIEPVLCNQGEREHIFNTNQPVLSS